MDLLSPGPRKPARRQLNGLTFIRYSCLDKRSDLCCVGPLIALRSESLWSAEDEDPIQVMSYLDMCASRRTQVLAPPEWERGAASACMQAFVQASSRSCFSSSCCLKPQREIVSVPQRAARQTRHHHHHHPRCRRSSRSLLGWGARWCSRTRPSRSVGDHTAS